MSRVENERSRAGKLRSGQEEKGADTGIQRQIWRPGNMLYPVPSVMVSAADEEGHANIITVAWAGTICSDPVMLSISIRPERYSYSMIRSRGEFVVNLTTRSLAWAADYCGVRSGRDVDKWKEAGLTPIPASKVSVPLIGESPVNLECRVRQILELGSHHMFLGEVVAVDVDPAYLDKRGTFHLEQADLIAYCHGRYRALGEEIGRFGYSVKKTAGAGNRKNAKSSRRTGR